MNVLSAIADWYNKYKDHQRRKHSLIEKLKEIAISGDFSNQNLENLTAAQQQLQIQLTEIKSACIKSLRLAIDAIDQNSNDAFQKEASFRGFQKYLGLNDKDIGKLKNNVHQWHMNEFSSALFRIMDSGKFDALDEKALMEGYRDHGITSQDLDRLKVVAYVKAVDFAETNDSYTRAKLVELDAIQQFLKLPEEKVATRRCSFEHVVLLREIENGILPTTQVDDLPLQKGEVVHWSERARLLEERVVDRHYEGGSHGVSVRIVKGVYYRAGAYRGHIVSEKAVIPVSSGELILTNKRVIFSGDAKSFNIKIEKILNVQFYKDGVDVTDDKGKPHQVEFLKTQNSDIVDGIFHHLLNIRAE